MASVCANFTGNWQHSSRLYIRRDRLSSRAQNILWVGSGEQSQNEGPTDPRLRGTEILECGTVELEDVCEGVYEGLLVSRKEVEE